MGETGVDIENLFMELATPEVYRTNAFRITQLSVDADGRAVRKQVKKIRKYEQLGKKWDEPGPLVLDPPPDMPTLNWAMNTLNDPVRRLFHEFFWFWPRETGNGQKDEGIEFLANGEVLKAASLWLKNESERFDCPVSTHNLAVLAHASAIDLEAWALKDRKGALTGEHLEKCGKFWKEAHKRWRRLLEEQVFWERLKERIRDMDQVQVQENSAEEIRRCLALFLLTIHARFAILAAESLDKESASRHVRLIRESGFSSEDARVAFSVVADPLYSRIRDVCREAEAKFKGAPKEAAAVVKDLADKTKTLLKTLGLGLPENDPILTGSHDTVARTCLDGIIQYANATQDLDITLKYLQSLRKIAKSDAMRDRVQEQIRNVVQALEQGSIWQTPQGSRLAPRFRNRLDEAKEAFDQQCFNEAIRILEGVLADEEFDESHRYAIEKPLSSCLCSRALKEIGGAGELIQGEKTLVGKMIRKMELAGGGEGLGPMRIAQMLTSNKCFGCNENGALIVGHLTLNFQGVPIPNIPICYTCMNRFQNDQKNMTNIINGVMSSAKRDVDEAVELDPNNPLAKQVEDQLDQLIQSGNFRIDRSKEKCESVEVSKEVGNLAPDLESRSCWFCYDARPAVEPRAYRVTLVRAKKKKKVRNKVFATVEKGFVLVPRCELCSGTHERYRKRLVKTIGSLLMLGICLAPCLAFADYSLSGDLRGSIATSLVTAGSLVTFGIYRSRSIRRHIHRASKETGGAKVVPVAEVQRHPRVQALCKEGWKIKVGKEKASA